MDKLTKHYRKSEVSQVQENQHGFRAQVKIVGIGGETKWLSITDAELKAIKKILTGEVK